MVSRLFEAARDIASDFLAAVGTSLYLLGFVGAMHLLGFFDAIYAAALDYADALDKLPC